MAPHSHRNASMRSRRAFSMARLVRSTTMRYERIMEDSARFVTGRSVRSPRSSCTSVHRTCCSAWRRAASDAAPATAALILPTGIEPTPGYGDMWVRFARIAATRGVATLRMDWRGNGESLPRPGCPENVSYGVHRTDDVSEGIAWLRARYPGAPVVVVGLCSGGYYAVHAVADGAGADRVIAINPQLYWHEGIPSHLDLDDLAPAVEMQLADGLERAMSDGRKWRRLLRGGYHWRDVLRAARGAAARRGWLISIGTRDESSSLGGRLPRIDLEQGLSWPSANASRVQRRRLRPPAPPGARPRGVRDADGASAHAPASPRGL